MNIVSFLCFDVRYNEGKVFIVLDVSLCCKLVNLIRGATFITYDSRVVLTRIVNYDCS